MGMEVPPPAGDFGVQVGNAIDDRHRQRPFGCVRRMRRPAECGNVASEARKRQSGCRIRAARSSREACRRCLISRQAEAPKTQGWKC